MNHPRTLIITLGQLRAHQTTWPNFRELVLDQLGADLAVCVGADDLLDISNPFYRNARYRWVVPVQSSLLQLLDRIQIVLGTSANWRTLCDMPGTWVARMASEDKPPNAAIPYLLRWFMLDNVRAAGLHDVYDRFVITRSDLYYLCPHPPLDCLDFDHLWFPDGEDYSGIMDKHLVVSAPQLFRSCSVLDGVLSEPDRIRKAVASRAHWTMNMEQAIYLHLETTGLLAKVRRFPYVMCLVRPSNDPADHTTGTYIPELGITIRFPSEFNEARRYRDLLDTNEKWRRYFSSIKSDVQCPGRIFTLHGTVLYVDESSGEMRHGSVADSPCNVVFVWREGYGEIVYRPEGEDQEVTITVDSATNALLAGNSKDTTRMPANFEKVPMTNGWGATNNRVGLRSNGVFLCAQPDGSIRLNRPHCQLWEHFRIVPMSIP